MELGLPLPLVSFLLLLLLEEVEAARLLRLLAALG
jgi:hypothetical protein